ncbi:retrovirus-related pol polyprotein from transposon TNT 1-94 [Tanacetum coccineum]
MRVASVNGKKYILIIVNYYSRFTWVKFLRSKDEALDFIIKFLKMIQVRLKVPVRRIRTDNGTEFVNQTLREYYEKVGISHETSVAHSPQQNGVVERRNRTLIDDARIMLIYAKALLFLWAEVVATALMVPINIHLTRKIKLLKADNMVIVNQIVTIFLIESSIHILDHFRYPVDTSLIHIESLKSPTESLFDVGSSRISIVIVKTKEYHSDVLAES